MRKWMAVGLVALCAAVPAMARVDFIPIAGGEFVSPVDFTADASVMVATGYFGAPYFTWTREGGLVEIGGGCGAGVPSISPDGSTIVGCNYNDEGLGESAIWLGGMEWQGMGSEPGAVPCGDSLSSPFDNNGITAVGLFWRPTVCDAIGGTWDLLTATAGPVLESVVPDRPTRGNAITDDGSIVFGWQDSEFGSRVASRWVGGVQSYITDAEGNNYGEVTGANSDGSVFWGVGYQYNGTGRAWLYRNGEFLPMGSGGNNQSVVNGASEDGSTVIGLWRNFTVGIQDGYIWTAKRGYQPFGEFLKGQAGAGWQQLLPTVISRDGRFIAGIGINPEGTPQAFLVDLKASGKPQ